MAEADLDDEVSIRLTPKAIAFVEWAQRAEAAGEPTGSLEAFDAGRESIAPQWTANVPTEPGWYWRKERRSHAVMITHVTELPYWGAQQYEWVGPLPEPL